MLALHVTYVLDPMTPYVVPWHTVVCVCVCMCFSTKLCLCVCQIHPQHCKHWHLQYQQHVEIPILFIRSHPYNVIILHVYEMFFIEFLSFTKKNSNYITKFYGAYMSSQQFDG